ncbi:MAG: hypothetical protein CM15mP75_0190 [Flammeovirgaceae bacterium]|nr:MAG: hypothetical protein CM15mP75_0190 [Flammeovirgaceae bacterium]
MLERRRRRYEPNRCSLVLDRNRRSSCRKIWSPAFHGAPFAEHSGHAGRELLRLRYGILPRRGLARGIGCRRYRTRVRCRKLKDTGYGGLPQRSRGAVNSMYWANASAPGSFAQLATAYSAKHGVEMEEIKRAMAQISVKSHENGAKNPKAHLQKPLISIRS